MNRPGQRVAGVELHDSRIGDQHPFRGVGTADPGPATNPIHGPNQVVHRELAKRLLCLTPERRVNRLVPCGRPGFLPPRDPLARFATDQEETDLHHPDRSGLFFAIWTVLALPNPDSDPGVKEETLAELYDDLHQDLMRIEASGAGLAPEAEHEAESDWADYEDLLIALP